MGASLSYLEHQTRLSSGIALGERYEQLDSLRGVAALVVVLTHLGIFGSKDTAAGIFRTPISPFLLGPAAVVLFFVLSGFVLTLPTLAGKGQTYIPYVVRRICRLYIPFALAVIASAILSVLPSASGVHDVPADVTAWWAHSSLSQTDLWRHLSMAGWPPSSIRLDPPMWSLIVEMRVSLVFPLLLILVARVGRPSILIAIALTIAAIRLKASIGDPAGTESSSALGSLLLTARYIGFFVFGILTAINLPALRDCYYKIPAIAHVVVAILTIAAFAIFAVTGKYNSIFNDCFYGLLSIYALLSGICSRHIKNVMLLTIPRWLGKISFSLYLIHWPVICATFIFSAGHIPLAAQLVIGFALSLGAGTVMEKWVERPSHLLGKQISGRLNVKLKMRWAPVSLRH